MEPQGIPNLVAPSPGKTPSAGKAKEIEPMRYAVFYVLSVVLINIAFSVIPPIPLPSGDLWAPVSLVVGFTFVLRDYAQRAIGHWVIGAMLLGGLISGLMADPHVALASVCAFLLSEGIDWLVFTLTGRPFSQRILLSSAFSTPVDSVVFLGMVGIFSVQGAILMTLSKMVGAVMVFFMVRRTERAGNTL